MKLIEILMQIISTVDERAQGIWKPSPSRPANASDTAIAHAPSLTWQSTDKGGAAAAIDQKLHILIPASSPGVELCKTLLSAAILDYPTPTLLAWNETFHNPHQMNGGAHMAKIAAVLDHLNAFSADQDEELVFMFDAYDIWFQLPRSVLLQRYNRIMTEGNRHLEEKYKGAAQKEGIKQSIIFGAGKKCAPNQVHTIACYPIPQSPLPEDLYGGNTDTTIGRNEHYSHRQRYLNSGYLIGPVAKVRQVFTAAAAKVERHIEPDPEDNGSGQSHHLYSGSDQSIFATLFGEQEYNREVKRRRLVPYNNARNRKAAQSGIVDALQPYEPDILNPPFTHEIPSYDPNLSREFSIGLDYFSDLGHQTVNSELDARFLYYNSSLEDQIFGQSRFDCPSRLPTDLPPDILSSTPIPQNLDLGLPPLHWQQIPLYSHLCTGTIPVMVHHNGDKSAIVEMWPNMWYHNLARSLLTIVHSKSRSITRAEDNESSNQSYVEPSPLLYEDHLLNPTLPREGLEWGGAWVANQKKFFTWHELCPIDLNEKIF